MSYIPKKPLSTNVETRDAAKYPMRYYLFRLLPPEPDETVWGVQGVEWTNVFGGDHSARAAIDDATGNLTAMIQHLNAKGRAHQIPAGWQTPREYIPPDCFEVCVDIRDGRIISFNYNE